MEWSALLPLTGGLVLLAVGGDALVRGSSGLASAAGISPLLIGLTLVSFGTSAPELAVSVGASLSGHSGIALGNVVGSNSLNVLFILGACALILPLTVARELVRREVPVMILASMVLFLVALDGSVSRLDGFLLTGGILAYLFFATRLVLRDRGPGGTEDRVRSTPSRHASRGLLASQLGLLVAGVGLLVLGARWLVEGAASVARTLGVSELVIGLTVVALGTSLPEVATSITATIRGQREIAIGNVVGSNIFNILMILGVSASLAPQGIPVPPAALRFDLPVMVATAVACFPVFFTGYRIARWEGALFLSYYVAYLLYLFLDSASHDAVPVFSAAMLWFVIPLTAVTLVIVSVRGWRRGNEVDLADPRHT